MPRFYVKNKDNKWNIFSTIIDGFIYDEFLEFDDLIFKVCAEIVEEKKKELKTLLTDKPILNTMSYQEVLNFVNNGGKE